MDTSNNAIEPSSKEVITRLLRTYLRPQLRNIVIAISCMCVAAGCTAALAWMMQPVLDDIFVSQKEDMLLPIASAVFVIAVTKGLATYIQSVIMQVLGQRVICDMQLDLYKHLLKSDIALFTSSASGTLISRFLNDIQIVRQNITNMLSGFVREPLTLIFLLGVMFYQNTQLAIVAFFAFPAAIYPIVWIGKRIRKLSKRTQEIVGKFTATLDDTFQGIRIVRAYGKEEHEIKHANDVIEKMFQLYTKAARVSAIASPMMESFAGMAIAVVIWYGGMQVLAGDTTPGAFFSFMTALIMAYRPVKSLSSLNTKLQEAIAALMRYYQVIDKKPSIIDRKNAPALSLGNTSIKFDNVSFQYEEGKAALSNISFEVPEGKRVALVGHSGGGKSTIMNLILRFYDPDTGIISIGEENIKDHTLASLRNAIAIVTQETTLFDDTVGANISYGIDNANKDDIIKAAKSAAAHDFIEELPASYNTLIGQRGVKLSGGQRQRIAIARAMLRNSPILLLDEATSSLDTVSEQQIQSALDMLMNNRTSLVIAHRLSTIMNADIIYVVKEGKIVESGTHTDLLKQGGEYYELYQRQFASSSLATAV